MRHFPVGITPCLSKEAPLFDCWLPPFFPVLCSALLLFCTIYYSEFIWVCFLPLYTFQQRQNQGTSVMTNTFLVAPLVPPHVPTIQRLTVISCYWVPHSNYSYYPVTIHAALVPQSDCLQLKCLSNPGHYTSVLCLVFCVCVPEWLSLAQPPCQPLPVVCLPAVQGFVCNLDFPVVWALYIVFPAALFCCDPAISWLRVWFLLPSSPTCDPPSLMPQHKYSGVFFFAMSCILGCSEYFLLFLSSQQLWHIFSTLLIDCFAAWWMCYLVSGWLLPLFF